MPALNSQQPPGSPVPARSIPPRITAPTRPRKLSPPQSSPRSTNRSPGMLLTLPQESREQARRAGERKNKEDRDQERATRTPSPGHPLRQLLSPYSPRAHPALVLRSRAALRPPHVPPRPALSFQPCPPFPSPPPSARRGPDSPKPRALPGSPQALPVPGSPHTSRLPPAGKQLTAPCYSPPSLRLSEEAPNRALRLAHMAYAEYRHPNNHRRKSRHSSLP